MKISGVENTKANVKAPEMKEVQKSQPVDRSVSEEIERLNEQEKKEEMLISQEMIDKSINQANKALEMYNRRIDRSIHEKTHTMMYKIVDTKTDEIIREFPPKKIQDMIAKMWELAGLFVDEKA